ncbi:MAG TPA: hypothetical protein PK760_07845 [Flavobacteriales bacterium]|nr:hypothetical protein [Flavobacteriales bacterium]
MSAFLKFGFPGLLLALGILLFRLLKTHDDTARNKKLAVLVFICFIIITIGAYLFNSYEQGAVLEPCAHKVDSLQRLEFTLRQDLQRAKADTIEWARLRQESIRMRYVLDSLDEQKQKLQGVVEKTTEPLEEIASRLEEDLFDVQLVSATGTPTRDDQYKRLKRSVFLNVSHYNGDKDLLARSLHALAEQRDDIIVGDIPRIIGYHKEILRIRRKWLKEIVIPELQRVRFASNGSAASAEAEVLIAPMVRFNKEVLDRVKVRDLRSMEQEVQLISNILISLRS